MTIGEASRLSNLSADTLRYYEKIGLLLAIPRDTQGRRQYARRDLIWIRMILRLKATHMPLEDIRAFARLRREGDASIPERLDILQRHRRRLDEQMEALQEHQRAVDEKIALCRQGGELV